jgi:tetratricopeptide (TPR) repeat protein
MQTHVARWLLSLILVAGAVATSLSSLNNQYALGSWGIAGLGAAMALVLSWCCRGRVFRILQRAFGGRQANTLSQPRLDPLDLALAATIAAATTQILVAVDLPSARFLPIHDTPGVDALYLILAGALAFLGVILAVHQGDRGRTLAALLAACVFSSNLYLRAMSTPEAGPGYGPVFACALLAAFTLRGSGARDRAATGHRLDRACALAGVVFLAAIALAVLFSPVPRDSLDFWLRWAVLLVVAAMLSLVIDTPERWRAVAWGTTIVAAALPVLLAGLKFVSLVLPFGLAGALSYRLHPNEFGGANLVARSVLCAVPLALVSIEHGHPRARRWIMAATIVVSTLVMVYAQSWEGFFALLLSLGVYGIGAYWPVVQRAGRWLAESPLRRWLAVAGIVVLAVPALVFSIQAARQLNVYSFNGRLIHWYGALLTWQEHPWVGGGPGSEILYAPYADQVGLVVDTQVTYDDPLLVARIQAGRSLQAHAHNLFLAIGSTAGLFGVLTFGLLVATILMAGLRARRRGSGISRVWVAGCLAGIAGALAWGMLDVLWVTPPFFSFPIWALIGLLLAVPRVDRAAAGEGVPASTAKPVAPARRWPALVPWLLVALSLLTVLRPALASATYASGFANLQEQNWLESVSDLEAASQLGWPDHQPYRLLAAAYLAQGDTDRSLAAYQRAASLQRGFSYYLSHLGWLAWLKGDLKAAIGYFEQAVERDPAEIGRYGLHAGLGLAYAAQGDDDRARRAFADAVELDPTSVLASPWVLAGDGSAGNTIILDPAYVEGPSPELEKRILSHLGAPDVTERVFAPIGGRSGTLNLGEVLDTVEADYHEAAAQGSREAPLILAALAEASRLAGFEKRAEGAYREFQALQPESAYGFRDLGVLCRDQGRLEEAQAWLERAVEVSPRDVDSRYNLALVYMDRELWVEAEQALDTIMSQSLTTLFRSRFFDADLHAAVSRLQRSVGDEEGALEASRRAAEIRGGPADYLAVADLYRALGRPAEVTGQCLQAWEALARTWPRPLDPLLWEMGTCLASSPGEELAREMSGISRREPLAGNVLVGHVHRVRGELDLALAAYQAAAAARPDEGAPHYFLGETYQALGRPEEAEAEYRQAAALDPLESLPLLSLGRMQWGQGWQEAAMESYRAAVEATPGWGPAQVALGNALLALGDIQGAAQHYLLAQRADRNLREGLVHDLAAELVASEIEAPGPGYVQNDYFNIDGDERRVLFMHPDSRARYTVDLPAGAVLSFALATGPDSWQQPGDGVTFVVRVETKEGAQEVFSTYIDPKGDQAARRWHPFEVDLEDYGGQSVILVLETGAGPAGDSRFDWAGWGRPQVLVP